LYIWAGLDDGFHLGPSDKVIAAFIGAQRQPIQLPERIAIDQLAVHCIGKELLGDAASPSDCVFG
jgi:hypothetical protein